MFGWRLACHEFSSSPLRFHDFYFQSEAWSQIISRDICGSFAKNVLSTGQTSFATLHLCFGNAKVTFPIQAALFSPVLGFQVSLTHLVRLPWRQWLNIYRNLEPQGTSLLLQQWQTVTMRMMINIYFAFYKCWVLSVLIVHMYFL